MPEEKSNSLRPVGRSRVSPPFPDLLPSRKRTLLLVDDDPLCARFIGHAARECGYSAIVTISAESFKAQLRDCKPDVVVVDLAMPGADGIELLRYLAGNNCTALVLIISGFDQRVVECAMRLGEALGLNMGRPLTKPVRFEEFSSAIQQKVEGSNAASLCL
jgi:DNA-binding response OmpR family regulator